MTEATYKPRVVQEVPAQPEKYKIVLELSPEEAASIWVVCQHVAGNMSGPRGHIDNVDCVLRHFIPSNVRSLSRPHEGIVHNGSCITFTDEASRLLKEAFAKGDK